MPPERVTGGVSDSVGRGNPDSRWPTGHPEQEDHMGYGVGGILILILVILAIIYFAKRV